MPRDLSGFTDDELWTELVRRGAAVRCGYCYPAACSDQDATQLVHEHGYEFGPWQHLELGDKLADPAFAWEMLARVPAAHRCRR